MRLQLGVGHHLHGLDLPASHFFSLFRSIIAPPQLNMVDNSSRNAEVVVYLRVLVFSEVFISKLHDFSVASLCPASSARVSERCITTSILAPEIVMAEFAGNLRSRLSHHAQFPWRALSLRQVVPVDVLHHHRGLVVLARHPSILASSFHPPHHGKILASTALNRRRRCTLMVGG